MLKYFEFISIYTLHIFVGLVPAATTALYSHRPDVVTDKFNRCFSTVV